MKNNIVTEPHLYITVEGHVPHRFQARLSGLQQLQLNKTKTKQKSTHEYGEAVSSGHSPRSLCVLQSSLPCGWVNAVVRSSRGD